MKIPQLIKNALQIIIFLSYIAYLFPSFCFSFSWLAVLLKDGTWWWFDFLLDFIGLELNLRDF